MGQLQTEFLDQNSTFGPKRKAVSVFGPNVTRAGLQSLLCRDNYSIKVSGNKRPPENPPEKDEDDKLKFQEYIIPIFMDFAEKNKIDPMVCYEVAHELELSLIENCRSKGFDSAEIEVHKHIAEMNWKTRKEEMMRDRKS